MKIDKQFTKRSTYQQRKERNFQFMIVKKKAGDHYKNICEEESLRDRIIFLLVCDRFLVWLLHNRRRFSISPKHRKVKAKIYPQSSTTESLKMLIKYSVVSSLKATNCI